MSSERIPSSRTPRQTLVNLTQSQEYQLALLDQQIISTLQNIDRIFVTCHDLIQNDLIPCVEEYSGSCREILTKSKVWLDFFDHLVNILPKRARSQASDYDFEPRQIQENSPEFIAPTTSMGTRAILQSFERFRDANKRFESNPFYQDLLESSPIIPSVDTRAQISTPQYQYTTEKDPNLTLSSPSFINHRVTPSIETRPRTVDSDIPSSSPLTNYYDLERVSSRLSTRALNEEKSNENTSSHRPFSVTSNSPSPDLVPLFTPRARTSLREFHRNLTSPADSSADLSSLTQKTPEQEIIDQLKLSPSGLAYGALHAALQHIPLDTLRQLLYILDKRKIISIKNNIVTLLP